MNRGSHGPDAAPEPAVAAASMRPRFMNRGSHNSRREGVNPIPGFNEAPIHESGKCGRDQVDVPDEPASMRPRFMNRGSPMCAASAG